MSPFVAAATDRPLPASISICGRRPRFILSVGLEAGAVIALQICIMRIFQVGSWAHFGSLVVSLAMLGFGLTSAVMCIRKDWFDRHWRGGRGGVAAPVRPADRRGQSAGAADSVQRHLPHLRSRCRSGGCSAISCSTCCRSWPARSSSAPCSSRPTRYSAASISPTSPAPGCAGSLSWSRCTSWRPTISSSCRCCSGSPAACCGSWRWQTGAARLGSRPWRCVVDRRAFRAAAAARHPEARGVGLQGRVLCAQIPRQPARLRERLAVRLSRGLFQLLSALRARALRQRGVQPAEDAGRTPISACISTARGRAASSATCRPSRPPITASCR